MNKEKMFVIGDVHGQITMLEELLEHWNPEEERLLFIGDLADRGENSKATLERAYQLMVEKEAIIIKGNHDEMLEKYLEKPSQYVDLYYMNGGDRTVYSLLGKSVSRKKHEEDAAEIQEKYPWLLPMLKSLPLYYEWGDFLFVHAGVNLRKKHWQESTAENFVWIREGFYDQPNTTDKKIVFGHTVSATLHGDMTNWDIWESGDGLFGIDGGAVYGGVLHGVVLAKDKKLNVYSIPNKGFRF